MFVPEPQDSHGDHPQGAVLLAAFLVARRERAELLAAADGVLHRVAPAVDGPVEGAGAVLVPAAGDGVPDAAAPAQRPDGAATVALVADDAVRAHARATASGAPDGARRQQPGEDRRLVALPRREHYGEGLAPALGFEVDLGAEAALAAPEGLGRRAPPFAPAACWCARITVPSTNWADQSTWPAASACRCTAANTRSHTPA